MNIDRIVMEVGRLYLRTIELETENADLKTALGALAGQAAVSESESAPDTLAAPSEDSSSEQAG